jgi:aspartate 1-decarboxylase
MKEFIEVLNQTNGDRLFAYCVAILVFTAIIGDIIVEKFKTFKKK